MSTTADLITALKAELKSARMTYADLARELGLAESTVKSHVSNALAKLGLDSRVQAALWWGEHAPAGEHATDAE